VKASPQQDVEKLFPSHLPLREAAVFILVFFGLQAAYQAARGTLIEYWIIDIATVRPSAWIIRLVDDNVLVRAQGHQLISPHFTMNILTGCEGTEALFLLVAAIVAYRTTWIHRLAGLVIGTAVIYCANQVRLVVLFLFSLRHPSWFEALHGSIAPTLIIAVGCLFFLGWTLWPLSPRRARHS